MVTDPSPPFTPFPPAFSSFPLNSSPTLLVPVSNPWAPHSVCSPYLSPFSPLFPPPPPPYVLSSLYLSEATSCSMLLGSLQRALRAQKKQSPCSQFWYPAGCRSWEEQLQGKSCWAPACLGWSMLHELLGEFSCQTLTKVSKEVGPQIFQRFIIWQNLLFSSFFPLPMGTAKGTMAIPTSKIPSPCSKASQQNDCQNFWVIFFFLPRFQKQLKHFAEIFPKNQSEADSWCGKTSA